MPLAIFVVASVSLINKQQQKVTDIESLNQALYQTIQLSQLLHEMQIERGMSAIYIASAGKVFIGQLASQHKKTDSVLASICQEKCTNAQGVSFHPDYSELAAELNQLRTRVSQFKVSTQSVIERYNSKTNELLNTIGEMVKSSAASSLTQRFFAYENFLKEKEYIGIERALLGSVFARDAFINSEYQYYVSLQTKQAVFRQEFSNWVSEDISSQLALIKSSAEYRKVEALREIAHQKSHTGNFGVDSVAWFEVMTNNINQLRLMEAWITRELLESAEKNKVSASYTKWLLITGLIGVALLTLFYGIKLINNIDGSFFRQLKEYRTILENGASPMVAIDKASQGIIFCNSQFASLLGHSEQQIASLNIMDVFFIEDGEEKQVPLREMACGDRNFLSKITLLTRDGRKVYTELSSFPINVQGEDYLIVNVKDITDEVFTQQRLNRSQLALQTILNSVDSAVSVAEHDTGEVIYLNNQAELIKKEQHQVEPLWPLLAPKASLIDSGPEVLGSHEYTEHSFNKSRKQWFQVTHKVIDWYDNRRVVLRMLDDITERYEIEHKNQNLLKEIRKISLKNFNLQEIERKEVAADLHDQLGQSMTAVMLQAEFVRHSIPPEHSELIASAQQISDTTQQLISSVREITNQLRPVLLDQLGLVEALRELVGQWQQLDLSTKFVFNSNSTKARLSDLIEISVYRIVQESLTNACKHAHASTIKVELNIEGNNAKGLLKLKVVDDGKGFDKKEVHFSGMGLINMRERVEALGGEFRIMANTGQGVSTLVAIPLQEVEGVY